MTPPRGTPLYRRILGESWDALPARVRELHAAPRAEGRASVERGENPFAWLVGAVMGFPPSGEYVSVSVRFDVDARGETWTRSFAEHSFSSRQYEGSVGGERVLCERFGLLEFKMALVLEDDRLALVTRSWSVLALPLPLWLAPRSTAYESEEAAVFHFFVEIGHSLVGLIVRYRGQLAPQPPGSDASEPVQVEALTINEQRP